MKKDDITYLRVLLTSTLCGLVGYGFWTVNSDPATEAKNRKVAFYQDSMHPWVKSDQPGKCTICGMDLTPIREGETGFGVNAGTVVLNSNSVTVLNVQTDEVKRQPLLRTLRVAGTLEANETRKAVVSAPIASRIHDLAVPYTGVEVTEGQMLVTLFSPELAQKRAFLRAVGINQPPPGSDLTQTDKTAAPFTSQLTAPQSGVVIERTVYNGQYVAEGEKLMTIADASVLWFRFDVYEGQLPWFAQGQSIDVTVAAAPGRTFPTTITFIDPTVSDATRSVKVRADIANPVMSTNGPARRALRFGMYAEGRLRAAIPNVLTVPRSAILFPGGSAYAYVDIGEGAYERRRVRLGREGDTCWEVLQGLEEGDRVVTSGNVLIDAQTQFDQGSEPASAERCAAAPEEAQTLASAVETAPVAASPGQSTCATPPSAASAAMPATAVEPRTAAAPPHPAKGKPPTRYQTSLVRMGVRDDMWRMRSALIAEAHGQAPAEPDTDPLFINPRQAQSDTNAVPNARRLNSKP